MTVLLTAELHPLGGAHADARALLDEHVNATREQDGCLGSEASSALDGDRYFLTSTWRDEAALRSHFRTAAYGRYADGITPLLAEPSRVAIHYVSQTVHPIGDPSLDPGRQG
jgi:quinol monooxygenase YgiN